MKRAIVRYVVENFDDLYELDMKWARILGAPAPHTISSYACLRASENRFWRWMKKFVDWAALRLFNQKEHCCTDLRRVQRGAKKPTPLT